MTDLTQPQIAQELAETPKFRGVLLWVAVLLPLGLLQSFLRFMISLAPFTTRKEWWETLTSPTSSAFDPNWKFVLIYEAISDTAVLCLSLAVFVTFFQKKRAFPKLITLALPVYFFLNFASYKLSGLVPALASSKDYSRQGSMLITQFVALHVWIPYFLLSRRVEKTFVK